MPDYTIPFQSRLPRQPDPDIALQALQNLQQDPMQSREQANPDLNLDLLRQQRMSEASDRANQAIQAGDPLENIAWSNKAAQLKSSLSDPITNPIERQRSQLQAADTANAMAALQGFGPQGTDASPAARMASYQRGAEMTKATMPLQVEKYKADAARQLEQDRVANMMKLFGGGGDTPGTPTGGSETRPGAAVPENAAGSPGKPIPSIGWWDFLSGKGPQYSNFSDLIQARSEREKYNRGIPTPFAPIAQETSFANLNQIQAQFPGIRGVQHLLDKFSEHQANWGYETPTATLQRMNGMLSMLGDLDQELNSPTLRFKTGPTGQLELAQPPQAIARAKILAGDTVRKLTAAKALMLQQYPNIEQSLSQAMGSR